jgi:hypothetical protein
LRCNHCLLEKHFGNQVVGLSNCDKLGCCCSVDVCSTCHQSQSLPLTPNEQGVHTVKHDDDMEKANEVSDLKIVMMDEPNTSSRLALRT